MAVTREPFGFTREGKKVEKFTIRCGGMSCEVLTFGGVVRSLVVPGGTDVVLGYETLDGYEDDAGSRMGAVVGRVANRVGGAKCVLDGRTVPLEANLGRHQLHGGSRGFSRQMFEGEPVGENSVYLRYDSPDGEGGWPGKLALTVVYTLAGDALRVRFQARSDAPTYCDPASHSYFNLNGSGSVLDHRLQIDAREFTPTDGDSIPTAQAAPVAGTPFDFTEAKPIGRDIGADDPYLRRAGGYDHNFVLRREQSLDPPPLARAATVTGGRLAMELWTQCPGVQLYTANSLRMDARARGGPRGPRDALCLETQLCPDSPNHPEWGDVVLRPGGRFDFTTEYRFREI